MGRMMYELNEEARAVEQGEWAESNRVSLVDSAPFRVTVATVGGRKRQVRYHPTRPHPKAVEIPSGLEPGGYVVVVELRSETTPTVWHPVDSWTFQV